MRILLMALNRPYYGNNRDDGKENGNYYIIIGYILGSYWRYVMVPNNMGFRAL